MAKSPDAAESNAGDDFHLLWAARRALRLLDTTGCLKAIQPEGPNPEDASNVDPDGDQLLGIDLTEYFGETNFTNATKVVFSQLKYSTRRSNENWTASKLSQGKKTDKYDGSIIHRLTQIFKTHIEAYGTDTVLSKLRICLISNRSCSEDLSKTMIEIREIFERLSNKINYADLRSNLSNRNQKEIERLKRGALGISSDEFVDFLRILDFTKCGTASRLDHELALIQELGNFSFQTATNQYNAIKNLIHRRMMPEARNSKVLTADDVVAALGIPRASSLFPAPPHFEPSKGIVERSCTQSIVQEIIKVNQQLICLHSSAGMGKTTFVRHLAKKLPSGSKLIVFDCYGGGTYLDPAEIRHSHRRAIMQICNDLAATIGTSLILSFDLTPEDLLREFKNRLDLATRILRSKSKDAILAIAIDAADNSITAANQCNEKSFVHDLVRCSFPEGCRLILTARSHRVDSFQPPESTSLIHIQEIQIPNFELAESQAHLRHFIPNATEIEVNEFHELSGAVPRVQRYALTDHQHNVHRVLTFLRPNTKTVDSIIAQQIKEAGDRLGSDLVLKAFFKTLLLLPRPIPINILAKITNVEADVIKDFCVDLCHGIRLENDLISFRDEDFETYLTQRFNLDESLFKITAEYFLEHSSTNQYMAEHVADLLYKANMSNEIIRLVHDEREPAIIDDTIKRKDVFVRRARFALEFVIKHNNHAETIKILFIVALAAKTDVAVTELLLDNLDLAFRFGDPRNLERLKLDLASDNIEWYGSSCLIFAAFYSGDEVSHDLSRNYFKSAEAWISWWADLSDDERSLNEITTEDLANGTCTVLRLDGIAKAKKWLLRWQPRIVSYEALRLLVSKMIQEHGFNAFDLLKNNYKFRADVIAMIVDISFRHGIFPPREMIVRGIEVWSRAIHFSVEPDPAVLQAGVSLCEAAAALDVMPSKMQSTLDFFLPNPPKYLHSSGYKMRSELGLFLRAKSMQFVIKGLALSPEMDDLLPLQLLENPDDQDNSEEIEKQRSKFKECYESILPAFNFRAISLLNERIEDAIFEDAVNSKNTDFYGNFNYDQRELAVLKYSIIAETIVLKSEDRLHKFQKLAKKVVAFKWWEFKLYLAELAAKVENLHTEALKLVNEIATYANSTPLSGNEKKDLFIKCSRITTQIDSELGKKYFQNAVQAASELDEEAFQLLQAMSSISLMTDPNTTATFDSIKLAGDFACFVENSRIKFDGWEYFPSEECIKALTHLSPDVGAALLCRWDQHLVFSFRDYAHVVIDALSSSHRISSHSPIYWMYSSSHFDIDHLPICLEALSALNEESPSIGNSSFAMFVDYCMRLTELSNRRRICERVIEWSRENPWTVGLPLNSIQEFVDFLDQNDVEEEHSFSKENLKYKIEKKKSESDLLNSVDWSSLNILTSYTEVEDLESSIRNVLSFCPQDSFYGSERLILTEYFRHLQDRVKPSEYVGHLNAIIEIDKNLIDFYTLKVILTGLLAKWDIHECVRDWKIRLVDVFSSRWFEEFWYDNHFSIAEITDIEERIGIDSILLIDAILNHLPEHIESINASHIYDFIKHQSTKLSSQEAFDVLSCIIPQYKNSTNPSGILLAASSILESITPLTEGLEALLLWYLFGHPDKRVRWQAIHTARASLNLNGNKLLSELAKCLLIGHNHPWCMPDKTFYWLAARQSFFTLVDKVSIENPKQIIPIANQIKNEILNPPETHAFITRLAKRIVIRVSKIDEKIFTEEELEQITTCSSPSIIPRNDADVTPNKYSFSETRRFHFDSMDTIPYWYSPLARIFGIETSQICEMAEAWICDKWHFSGDVRSTDQIRDYDWSLRSHRHGSQPTVEDLQTYLEFHAMQCVAAELSNSMPILESYWEQEDNEWEEWLDRFDLVEREYWLSDLRQKTPLEPRFWKPDSWTDTNVPPQKEDFDLSIGMTGDIHPNSIVVCSHERIFQSSETSEYSNVYSAIVSPVAAQALMSALKSCKDSSYYYLPWEGGESEINHIIADTEFSLCGWISSLEKDRGDADQDDPFRYSFSLDPICPGNAVTNFFKLIEKKQWTNWFTKFDEEFPIFFVERWNDFVPNRQHHGFATSGNRLWIRFSKLLEYLQFTNRALLIQSQIWRRQTNHSTRNEEKDHGRRVQLYIIYSDGTIETTSGSHRSR